MVVRYQRRGHRKRVGKQHLLRDLAGQGKTVAEAAKILGIAKATAYHYAWKFDIEFKRKAHFRGVTARRKARDKAIVAMVRKRPDVARRTVAAEFEVSEPTVFRALRAAGLPTRGAARASQ